VTLTASPKVAAYAALGSAGILVALIWGYPEAAVFGLPFVVAVLAGLALVERPRIGAAIEIDRDRLLEGEEVRVSVTLTSDAAVPWLQLAWPLPSNLTVAGGGEVVGVSLAAGEPLVVETSLTTTRWGVVRLPGLLIRAHDELGFFRFEGSVDQGRIMRVYPRPETLRKASSALETQIFGGNELSRAAGDGTEFADTRPYVAGDRPRRINWRLSTRTGALHINEMHPERNSDVIIFLDLFTDVRNGGEGTLDYAVRAATSLAEYYLARRDRVGVIGFGGVLRWLLPAMGSRQIYRIVDSLIDSEVFVSHVWRGIDVIPPRTLPPKSLIVALTPLMDDRVIDSLVDLRARGFDLIVVEVMAEPFAVPGGHEAAQLAHRLWKLDRNATRLRYRSLGVPIVQWRTGESLAGPLAEARRFGRRDQWPHA
jgi:uncharacterized protein (DUF58 family)